MGVADHRKALDLGDALHDALAGILDRLDQLDRRIAGLERAEAARAAASDESPDA